MRKKVLCNICRSNSTLVFVKNDFVHYECDQCGLIFVAPMPTDDELGKIYSSANGYQKNRLSVDKDKVPKNKSYQKILTYIQRKKPNSSTLLDIGCSNGNFLMMSKESGYVVEGVELNESTAHVAISRGLQVHIGRLSEINKKFYYDIIHLGDLIEHVREPRLLIEQITQVLKIDGLLIITTPNMNCFWARTTRKISKLLGIDWSLATPPYHLYQFSDNNLDMLLGEYDYAVVDRWFNHLPNLFYELGQTHVLGRWKRERNLLNFMRLIFGVFAYTTTYIINFATRFFRRNDMGMVSIYYKDNLTNNLNR